MFVVWYCVWLDCPVRVCVCVTCVVGVGCCVGLCLYVRMYVCRCVSCCHCVRSVTSLWYRVVVVVVVRAVVVVVAAGVGVVCCLMWRCLAIVVWAVVMLCWRTYGSCVVCFSVEYVVWFRV